MKKIYFDMDGVLADFDGQPNALKRFNVEKGFFQTLKPTCLATELNIWLGQSAELRERVYILSASPNLQADTDKWVWLNMYMPNLKAENIIIVRNDERVSERKAEHAHKNSILVDDYTKNLLTWESLGGKGVKCLNGRNGNGKTWKGETLKLEITLG